jgi:guanylate kinase
MTRNRFIHIGVFETILGRFVEHGEYERNYYGTSLSAIETVVQSGKICVLNLHVHSIPLLREGHAGQHQFSLLSITLLLIIFIEDFCFDE